MIKLWDLKCAECGEILYHEFVEDEQYPECCSRPMSKMPGGHYHENWIDRRRRKRNPNTNFKPDALTAATIREGEAKRKKRLGGTGKM